MTPEQTDKNGPAFQQNVIEPEMTLRDYFAGQALAGLASKTSYLTPDTPAKIAYKYADAMLKQRNGG